MGRTLTKPYALGKTQRQRPYAVRTRHRHRSWHKSRRHQAEYLAPKTSAQRNIADRLAAWPGADDRGLVGLSDMPPELVEAIGAHLDDPRDLASARVASRLFCQTLFEEAVVAWGAGHLSRLVAAGAPLHIVGAAIALRAQTIGFGLLACAAQGGREDVVRLILGLVEVRFSSWSPCRFHKRRIRSFLFFCSCHLHTHDPLLACFSSCLVQDAHTRKNARGNGGDHHNDSDSDSDSDSSSSDSDSDSSSDSDDSSDSDGKNVDDDTIRGNDSGVDAKGVIGTLTPYLDKRVLNDVERLVSQTRTRRSTLLGDVYARAASNVRPDDDTEYLCKCAEGKHQYACIPKAAKGALRAALIHARVNALRAMTRSKLVGHYMGARQNIINFDGVSHMALAAASGRADMIIYLHDRAMMGRANYGSLCGCRRDVYEAALKAPRPDALLWMRDNQCDAYVQPGRHEILDAIASRDAGRTFLAMSLSRDRGQTKDKKHDREEDRAAILKALASKAAEGNWSLLRVAIDEGYCDDITPLLAGAASHGRADVAEWLVAVHNGRIEPHMSQSDSEETFSPCHAYTVMGAAAAAERLEVVAWISQRTTCASVAAGALWSTLAGNPSLEAVRALDAVLREPFPWQRAAPVIIRSCRVSVLRFAVEERGVVIEPSMMCLLPDSPTDDMADYLCSYFTQQQLQHALDAVCAQRDRTDDSKRGIVDGLLARVPDLCVAVRDACAAIEAPMPPVGPARLGRCDCAACRALRPPA